MTLRQKYPSEYSSWHHLRDRCFNPSNPAYKDYGARGITVDSSWDTFERFFADMGPKPSPKHSIDRINNDMGYRKDNCRWATPSEQFYNARVYIPPPRTDKVKYQRKYPSGKPLSERAARIALIALLPSVKLTLTSKPAPAVFVGDESEARFFGSTWEEVVKQAILQTTKPNSND